MRLSSEVEAFLGRFAPVEQGDGIVVAFSGGPDSTALLWALLQAAQSLDLHISAFHVDHGFDSGSAERCAGAEELARRLGAPFRKIRLEGETLRRAGEGVEEASRRLRYAALEDERLCRKARYVATAHHRDDQAETVVLRLLFGSGLEGLAGTLPVRGSVIRPFLALSREEIAAALENIEGISPLRDPTNQDLRHLRNRLRLHLLPWLEDREPGISTRLAALAVRAGRARDRLEARMETLLAPVRDPAGGITVGVARLRELPAPLLPHALAFLHRRAGAPHPPGAAARSDLERQLAAAEGGRRLGCDCGGGWRWEIRADRGSRDAAGADKAGGAAGGDRFAVRPPTRPSPGREIRFTYTLRVPGEIEIPEISVRFKISSGEERPTLACDGSLRARLALPANARGLVTLRNRLPGDRLRPLGAPGRRRLKEVLIDRRVPRDERDRILLVCCEDRIAWVPGVTIEHDFRVLDGEDGEEGWIAEITYL